MCHIHFVVQFPFPDKDQSERIWKGIFPSNTPTSGLDYTKLANLNIVGGNIRNIALNAAFMAAEKNDMVTMKNISKAVRSEFLKIEKSLTVSKLSWLD